ncbi:DUF2202 domain-containing protein [Cumulibacter manganitolerans]|uniref:DUF2202 domain-containing protein n=1 Tax=Cumulibacter manganitolerans TaxID=1884992 RepID=UPI0012958462|nr:DUF2202 domain-containing protein [Cumulibacter manganitolerans]
MIKNRRLQLGIAATTVAVLATVGATAAFGLPPTDAPGTPGQGPNATATATEPLSEAEKGDLLLTREEERLARELYQAFGDKYPDVTFFKNVAVSEDHHAEAVGRALTRYDLADPSASATPGQYADSTLQGLYDKWYAQGMQSEQEAIKVGVELEKTDIDGLKKAIETSDNADLDQLYGRLLWGSQHHLAGYEALANGQDPTGQCATDAAGQGQGPNQGQAHGAGRGEGRGPDHGQGQGHGPADGQGPGQG